LSGGAHGKTRSRGVNGAIGKIAVVGDGAVAWIAASGLLRALRNRPLEVWVVGSGGGQAPAGYWTLPSQRGMHGLLGMPEPDFLQQTGSTFRLGSEHRGWQGEGSRFLHAHGDIGTDLGGTPFYKYLQAEAVDGRPTLPEYWSLAGAAARQGRFARPMGKDLTASFTYGFHIDAARYTACLRAHADKLGVRAATAPLAEVLTGEGRIDALRLADGSLLEADLYLDCSGHAARLLDRISPEREDWSAWLPCDRMISAAAPPARDPAPLTQTLAGDAGWCWRMPLADQSWVGLVYSSAFTSDEAARATLTAFEPGVRGEPAPVRFSSGHRRNSWVGNCVALGDAAMELEPLVGASLHFAQLGLATLVELFPLNRGSKVEAQEYNRLMREQADALRDFTIAHYRAGAPRNGAFWQAARAQPLPARLAHKLDLYAASGRIVLLDHETFEETDWAWLLIGSGFVPAAVELQVRGHLARIAPRELDSLRERIQQLAASMPPHAEFVRRQMAAPPRTNS
jgi:tryptophan halogenase